MVNFQYVCHMPKQTRILKFSNITLFEESHNFSTRIYRTSFTFHSRSYHKWLGRTYTATDAFFKEKQKFGVNIAKNDGSKPYSNNAFCKYIIYYTAQKCLHGSKPTRIEWLSDIKINGILIFIFILFLTN